jgi:hypothetical protein
MRTVSTNVHDAFAGVLGSRQQRGDVLAVPKYLPRRKPSVNVWYVVGSKVKMQERKNGFRGNLKKREGIVG